MCDSYFEQVIGRELVEHGRQQAVFARHKQVVQALFSGFSGAPAPSLAKDAVRGRRKLREQFLQSLDNWFEFSRPVTSSVSPADRHAFDEI